MQLRWLAITSNCQEPGREGGCWDGDILIGGCALRPTRFGYPRWECWMRACDKPEGNRHGARYMWVDEKGAAKRFVEAAYLSKRRDVRAAWKAWVREDPTRQHGRD